MRCTRLRTRKDSFSLRTGRAISLPFRRQSPTERDSALRGLPAPRAQPVEPHPTLGASDTGLGPGSEATQIVLCMVYRPSGSIVRAFNRRVGRFQRHDLGLLLRGERTSQRVIRVPAIDPASEVLQSTRRMTVEKLCFGGGLEPAPSQRKSRLSRSFFVTAFFLYAFHISFHGIFTLRFEVVKRIRT
jgi:hypothetical protein